MSMRVKFCTPIAALLSLLALLLTAGVLGARLGGRDLSRTLEPEVIRNFRKNPKPYVRMPRIPEERTVTFRNVPSQTSCLESYTMPVHEAVFSQLPTDYDIRKEFRDWVLSCSSPHETRIQAETEVATKVYYNSDLVVARIVFLRDRYPELLTEYEKKADIPQLVEECTAKQGLPEITLESFLSHVFGADDHQEAVNFVDWLKVGLVNSTLYYERYYKLLRLYEYYLKFIIASQFSRPREFKGYPKKLEHINLVKKTGSTDRKAMILLEQHIYPLVSEEKHSLTNPSIELKHFKELLMKEGGHPFDEIQQFRAWLKRKHSLSIKIYDNVSYNQEQLFINYVKWIEEYPNLSKNWLSLENSLEFPIIKKIEMNGVNQTAQELHNLKMCPNRTLKMLIDEMDVPIEDKKAMKIYYLKVKKYDNNFQAQGIPWTTRMVRERYNNLRSLYHL